MDTPPAGTRSHRGGDDRADPVLTRRHLLFGGTAAVTTLGYWSYANGGGSESAQTAPIGSTSTTSTPPPTVTTPPSPAPDTTTPLVPALTRDLAQGMVGSDVEAVQAVLAERRFDPGPIDGIFGSATLSAVWAFDKIVLGTPRSEMRGTVTAAMWDRMNGEFRVAPRRSPGGTHMEVYLPEQVSVLFVDGEARVVSHVSSGEGVEWCDVVEIDLEDGTTEEKGICGISITPGGVYHFERKVEGWRNAKLGRLYQPVYFNYGIAIHGAGNVPDYPASRGCVRHPMHVAEYLPDLIAIGDMIYVFDGVEEPEAYGAQPMIFDYPDPNWVAPTTTTTVPPTTTTTTVPPTTTTTTTTTVPPRATTTSTTAPKTSTSSTTAPPGATPDA